MRYLSVCSGIEAASVAWEPLGWSPAAFAEIEKFPARVLAARFGSNLPGEPPARNGVPNLGDITRYQEWPDLGPIDLLVGGTPCQSFSVAGLRRGLDDPRGALMLVYLSLARKHRPRWLVWENVPGALSADGGRAFGTLLGGLAELGYGFAWRVLDAQYVRVDGLERAVPQRRRRVFVVGHSGGCWRRAAAVLLEREGLSGNPPPRREAGQGAAGAAAGGARIGGAGDIAGAVSAKWAKGSGGPAGDEAYNLVAHTLGAAGTSIRSADGGTPLVPIAFDARQSDVILYGDRAGPLDTNGGSQAICFTAKDHGADALFDLLPTLRAGGFSESHANAGVMPAIAFDLRGRDGGAMPEGPHETANIRAASGRSSRSYVAYGIDSDALDRSGEAADGTAASRAGLGIVEGISPALRASRPNAVAADWAVRRLTPRECERLQGFPDGWTDIGGSPRGDDRGGPTPDGPRYRALGNSMAVNVMRWLGRRIEAVERVAREMGA